MSFKIKNFGVRFDDEKLYKPLIGNTSEDAIRRLCLPYFDINFVLERDGKETTETIRVNCSQLEFLNDEVKQNREI